MQRARGKGGGGGFIVYGLAYPSWDVLDNIVSTRSWKRIITTDPNVNCLKRNNKKESGTLEAEKKNTIFYWLLVHLTV